MAHPGHVVGGLGPEKPADKKIQALCDLIKCEFEKQSGVNAAKFEVLSYATQVVAGNIYYVKVDLGDQICLVKILEPLPHTGEKASLSGFQCGKKKEDPICFF